MKANALQTHAVWLVVLAFCACTTGGGASERAHDPGQDATAGEPGGQAATTSAELAVLDRKQASYLTTSLHASSGERFEEGFARLDIVPKDGRAQINLAMTAARADGTPWHASFELAESQVFGRVLRSDAELADLRATLSHAQHRIAGHLQAERPSGAKLALAREALPQTRPALLGHLVFDDGASADFRTEYDVRCWAPAGAPGTAQVQQDPGFSATLLTQDTHFESDFCRSFSALR
jgi:hypothetical protein